MAESKIELKDGTTIKITGGGQKENASISIYSGDYRDKDNHKATHININTSTGKGTIIEHDEKHENTTKTDIKCFLTTACMHHYKNNFDDNCYELTVLRWFRDNFVATEDINHYYEIAPIIVKSINESLDSNEIYKSIYKRIILVCVNAIQNGNYELAYNTYRNAILDLETEYARPALAERLVRVLKTQVRSNTI